MPTLFEVVDEREYHAAVDLGYISVRKHPTLPYLIHNYTDAALWNNYWPDAVQVCRGIVTHADTGGIIARPFRKFFNHGQEGAPNIARDAPVVVTDKVDGSLGIAVPTPEGTIIASRGSFTSEQAVKGTQILKDKYPDFNPTPGWTYLFEIIYPENRIVLDYKGLTDLILLGIVDTNTGRTISQTYPGAWTGPVVEFMPYCAFEEALEAQPRPNSEGLVVWDWQSDTRVKLKQEDYLLLHKAISRMSPLAIWESLSKGETLTDRFPCLPDEFLVWYQVQASALHDSFESMSGVLHFEYQQVISDLAGIDAHFERKDFAKAVKDHPNRGAMFLLLDGKPLDDVIWKAIRPHGNSPL